MHVLTAKAFGVMTRIAKIWDFAVQELRVAALVRGMAAVAHSYFERPMLFLPPQFLVHMAIKAETGRRFRQEKTRFRSMRLMTRGTPSARDRLMAVLAAGKRFPIMAPVTQLRLLCKQKLFRSGLMRSMASKAIALLYRCMSDPVSKNALIVAGIAEIRGLGRKQVLRILRVRVVACRAFP